MTLGKALHLSEPQFPQSVQLVFLTTGRLAELQLGTQISVPLIQCVVPSPTKGTVSVVMASSSLSL